MFIVIKYFYQMLNTGNSWCNSSNFVLSAINGVRNRYYTLTIR